jgi:hypothetical protein
MSKADEKSTPRAPVAHPLVGPGEKVILRPSAYTLELLAFAEHVLRPFLKGGRPRGLDDAVRRELITGLAAHIRSEAETGCRMNTRRAIRKVRGSLDKRGLAVSDSVIRKQIVSPARRLAKSSNK